MNVGELEQARRLIEESSDIQGSVDGTPLTWRVWLAYIEDDIPALRSGLDDLIEFERASDQDFWNTFIAYLILWLDGPEATMPWLEQAYQAREFFLVWPDSFFLPETHSQDPVWLAFWQRPGLAELIEMRHANGQTDIPTAWKPRPEQP